ncbi:MAG: 4-(cytidine 5'-diphospho)-2-C-methyl-D-erythritol kinase [Xanthobacteraceae bacterium]|nr:4-(cytidine 5'-diphospho)-2-C-methyl-D-erythritol kinase [Xanthobacteraceae bacterium]
MLRLTNRAPAKVNLTLRVLRRRSDGFHELASLVAFAAVGDDLALNPGSALELTISGPTAMSTGPDADNLVLVAARALAERIERLKLGRFDLVKRLPVGAGLGGGSSDAAAALRLIAQANDLAPDDPRLLDAARATGADVPVCLEAKARLMHGVGEKLSSPIELPKLPAVIVYPGVPVATASVFRALELVPGNRREKPYSEGDIPKERAALYEFLANEANDLERAARSQVPVIAAAQECLNDTNGVRLIRMSGSGSSLFGLYDSAEEAEEAAGEIRAGRPDWWVVATILA